jgi:hypothetical protein
VIEPDDLDLLGRLIIEVRERGADAKVTGRSAQLAIQVNNAAQRRCLAAVVALRELVAAMTDSAGHDGRHDICDARETAVAILDGSR